MTILGKVVDHFSRHLFSMGSDRPSDVDRPRGGGSSRMVSVLGVGTILGIVTVQKQVTILWMVAILESNGDIRFSVAT